MGAMRRAHDPHKQGSCQQCVKCSNGMAAMQPVLVLSSPLCAPAIGQVLIVHGCYAYRAWVALQCLTVTFWPHYHQQYAVIDHGTRGGRDPKGVARCAGGRGVPLPCVSEILTSPLRATPDAHSAHAPATRQRNPERPTNGHGAAHAHYAPTAPHAAPSRLTCPQHSAILSARVTHRARGDQRPDCPKVGSA